VVPSNFIWNHHAIAKRMYCGVGVHKQDVQIRLANYLTGGFLLQAVRGKQDYTSEGMYMPFIFHLFHLFLSLAINMALVI
jgi:hypothetical protein